MEAAMLLRSLIATILLQEVVRRGRHMVEVR